MITTQGTRPAADALEAEVMALASRGRLAEAVAKADRLIASATELWPVHGLAVLCLLKLGRRTEAIAALQSYGALPCGQARACDSIAFAARALGLHGDALRFYRLATTLTPRDPTAWYNLAAAERVFGRLEAAEDACHHTIALDPDHFPGYLLRGELRTQTAASNHVQELRSQLSRSDLPPRGRMFLAYALAKELDDLEQYSDAFTWFADGARTRRQSLSYDVTVDEGKLARIRAVFSGDKSAPPSPASDSRRFIFIVGLPRSGTTLVERILTGLPGVRSNGETDHVAEALMSSLPPASGDLFERAVSADGARVGEAYRRLADGDAVATHVIDKLPLNFLYLGSIRHALPDAPVIWVRRAPLDSCFAMYRTLFGRGYPFSYDFDELARYFAAYAALMEHWCRTLRGGMLAIDYEDLVARPAEVGQTMAKHCGIPWRDSAVHIEKNAGVSLTASASQVRRPIHRASAGKWRRYRQHLDPLMAALRAHDIPLPQDA